ncbi:hypothetical protein FQN54_009661 [Arachnomyces sp. PD_36]|nr:hypothetical protein FQN54_009661 [Arachnomyces sp. PD_36]
MPLLDLPNEILWIIAEHLDSESDINSLTRTNVQLYNRLCDRLYSNNAKHHNSSALPWAVDRGRKETALKSLRNGADVEVQGGFSRWLMVYPYRDGVELTPLRLALRLGRMEFAELLLKFGARVYDPCEGATPLWEAIYTGRTAVVKLLVEHGAEVNAEDGFVTLLARAVAGKDEELVMFLLEKGAEVNVYSLWRGLNRMQPLVVAAEVGRERFVRALIDRGAYVNYRTDDGVTPLDRAIRYGHEEVAKLLIEKGAGVNPGLCGGHTPLTLAAENGLAGVVQLLLENGADIEGRTARGQTPLMLAAKGGHEEVVRLLVDRRAWFHAKDMEGRTALCWASENGNEQVVKQLQPSHPTTDTRRGTRDKRASRLGKHFSFLKISNKSKKPGIAA